MGNEMCTFLLIIFTIISLSCGGRNVIRYASTEHPAVVYYNTKYLSYVNVSSRRYGRYDPLYYLGLNYSSKLEFGNNVLLGFYFYEFLTYRYERGFVEMHFKFCDLVKNDLLFGAALKQGKLAQPCPYPPGEYILSNMTMAVQHIPQNFPFKKGRIYCNITLAATKERILDGHIDMEIKEWKSKRNLN